MADITEGMKVKRMRYFDGLFLTQEEFNLEQNYHIRMRRLHNRHLHRCGIVWGLDVVADGTDRVKITKGMALNKAKGAVDEGNEDEDISQEIVLTDDGTLILESEDIKKGVYIYLDFEKVENYIVAERGGTEEIHWLEDAVFGYTIDINQIKENEGQLILAKVKNATGIVNENSIKYFKDTNEPLRTYAGAYGNLTLPIEKEKPDEEESSDFPTIKGKKIGGENGIRIDSPKTEFTGSVDVGGDLNVTGTVNGNLANDIVGTNQIIDDAVTADKIASGSVGTPELANDAVTSAKLTSDMIDDIFRAVTTNHIRNNAVTEAKLEQAVRDKLATVVSPELVQEIEDARGIKSTLGNRLDESLTAGGQLRHNVVGEDQLDASTRGKLVTNGDNHDHSRVSNYFQFGNLNQSSVDVSSSWTKLITTSGTHSFTKSRGDTIIEVHVNSRFSGGTFTGALGIHFQLRIDDNISPNFGNDGAILTSNTADFLSIYAVFQNLTAGPHTVSLWARTNAGYSSSVFLDPGGWGGKIIVKESW